MPTGQVWRPNSASFTMTRSPTHRLFWGFSHLERRWSSCRYFLLNWLHRSARRRCVRFQRRRLLIAVMESAGRGTARRGRPMRKCPGVSTGIPSSDMESVGSRGRLLMVAPASVSTVASSSNVSRCSPMVFFRTPFINLTDASHNPPQSGELCWVRSST